MLAKFLNRLTPFSLCCGVGTLRRNTATPRVFRPRKIGTQALASKRKRGKALFNELNEQHTGACSKD